MCAAALVLDLRQAVSHERRVRVNEAGPVADGLDTRFGAYFGKVSGSQVQYPPDVITTQPSPILTVNTGNRGCSSSSPCIQDGNKGMVAASNIDRQVIFDYNSYGAALNAKH